MNFSEWLFIIQLFAVMAILAVKVYNTFKVGKLYTMQTGVMLFVGYFIFWFIGQQVTLFLDYNIFSNLLFVQLFRLETLGIV